MPGTRAWLAGLTLLVLSMALPMPPSIAGAGPSVATTTRLTASGPAPRDDAAMAYDAAADQVVLFGGVGFDDTWTWDGTSWTEQYPSHTPSIGWPCMAMAYDAARGRVVLFGCSGSLSETWTWDGLDWTQEHPQTSPPFSDNLGMAYDAATRKVVLFLGDASTWSWDGSNWTEEQPPSSPFYRGFEAMVRFGRDVLLFGGVEGIESPTYFNDTWIWDGSTWTQQSPTKRPSPRCCMGAAYDLVHHRAVLFGGQNYGLGVLGGTWTWNGTNWLRRAPAESPSPRWGPGMTYDSTRDQVVLFGGFNGVSDTGDTWIWDGTNWTCVLGCA